jgi:hypothetical protein
MGLSVRLSVCRHASTAACKTICLKEIKKASRNAERFAGSYDITYIQSTLKRDLHRNFTLTDKPMS